jgi:hypothetical protein
MQDHNPSCKSPRPEDYSLMTAAKDSRPTGRHRLARARKLPSTESAKTNIVAAFWLKSWSSLYDLKPGNPQTQDPLKINRNPYNSTEIRGNPCSSRKAIKYNRNL